MRKVIGRSAPLVLGIICVAGILTFSSIAQSVETSIDPRSDQILKKMCDYLGNLQQFSVHTQNTLEDTLDSGHRVDFEIAADVVISRPDKLRAERKGDVIDQIFFYDGKTLTLYNPSEEVYATESAPGAIEDMLSFARESLGLIIPVGDLVYRNAYPLLIDDVTFSVVIGKSVVSGVTCDHLLFSRPGVDFQVWVADKGAPLPYKYVITDTGSPARLSISTVMSEWNVKPSVIDDRFSFEPPKDAGLIDFMPF
jgi:hypothetical protein